MLDLHCHLLPGVDDGPETLDEALDMARLAVDDGIRISVLTPHLYADRPIPRHELQAAFDSYAAQLKSQDIPLEVHLGCEAHLSPELLDLIADDQVPFVGQVDGYRILLVEFPHQMIPLGSDKLLTVLLRQKIRPLIAHPERNAAVMDQPERIRPFTELGCWLQITSGSLAGNFGPRSEQTAWQLFEAGYNCVLASDAHGSMLRPPCMSKGRLALQRRYGEQFADEHVSHKPARILGVEVEAALTA